jgi:hypothetical protein
MYHIRIEKHYASRWYKADNLTDAMELFDSLSKVLPLVQVWQGSSIISEYKVN